jgi:hypothetical protein
MNFKFIVAMGLLLIAGRAGALDTAQPIRAQYHSELERVDSEGEPTTRTLDWQFERAGEYVEISAPSEHRAEQWTRDATGRVWYARTFHTERKVIEYQPSDLALGGISGSWDQIRSVIDPRLLAGLERTTTVQEIAGHRAVLYRGREREVETEVWWIEDLGIPGLVSRRGRRTGSTLRLIGVSSIADRAAPRPPQDYELIDFSDLGDRHHDEFVERLMKYDGLWFGHGQ